MMGNSGLTGMLSRSDRLADDVNRCDHVMAEVILHSGQSVLPGWRLTGQLAEDVLCRGQDP